MWVGATLYECLYGGSAAIANCAMERRDSALVDRIWIGASPNKPGNDLCLGACIPRRHARPTVNGIVKWFGTAPVPGANVGAPGDQLLCNAGLKCRCRHVQGGIALVNVVTNPVEEVSLRILACCAGTCSLFRQPRRRIKQSNGGQLVTGGDCLHEGRERDAREVAGIQLLSPFAGANHMEAGACRNSLSGPAAMSLGGPGLGCRCGEIVAIGDGSLRPQSRTLPATGPVTAALASSPASRIRAQD